MGPVRQPNPENCKNCSSKCAYDCATSVHNTTQNSSDNLPFYLKTNIIALSEERGCKWQMAERLLRTQPDLAANHVTEHAISD